MANEIFRPRAAIGGMLALCLLAAASAPARAGDEKPHVVGGSPAQRGEYIVSIAGCHDCHTPGWMEHPGEIPTALLLSGNPQGWHGPWGNSFPTNLRTLVAGLTEQQWLQLIHSFHPLPPMPGYNVAAMSEQDQLAVYAYIRSLGPAGKPAPAAQPPGPPPAAPYFALVLPAAK